MAMMISYHRQGDKGKGKGNGLDRVSEYILTYKCYRNQKFNLWLLQNLMMIYTMRIDFDFRDDEDFTIIDPSSPSAGQTSTFILAC